MPSDLAGTGLAGLVGMLKMIVVFVLALIAPAFAQLTDYRVAPPPAKSDDRPVQHGAQPNPQEVRPGSPQGDAPSAAVGTLERDRVERRVLGLPITAVLVIGAALIAILALVGLVIPRARRRDRARGGGSYGRP
jgi:hypothetical protein